MPGSLVEYRRFVEVQQRRARIVAELKRLPATPLPPVVDRFIEVGESVTAVDAGATPGNGDVR